MCAEFVKIAAAYSALAYRRCVLCSCSWQALFYAGSACVVDVCCFCVVD